MRFDRDAHAHRSDVFVCEDAWKFHFLFILIFVSFFISTAKNEIFIQYWCEWVWMLIYSEDLAAKERNKEIK